MYPYSRCKCYRWQNPMQQQTTTDCSKCSTSRISWIYDTFARSIDTCGWFWCDHLETPERKKRTQIKREKELWSHSPCAARSTIACNFWCSILTLMILEPMHKNMPNAWLVPTTTIAVRNANMKKFDIFWYANVILVAINASIWNEMYHTVTDSKKSLIGSVRRRVKMRNRTIVNSFRASTLNVIADIVLWFFIFLCFKIEFLKLTG